VPRIEGEYTGSVCPQSEDVVHCEGLKGEGPRQYQLVAYCHVRDMGVATALPFSWPWYVP
jgi:hypothetical protein